MNIPVTNGRLANVSTSIGASCVLRRLPIIRSFGQTSPSYHTGSILENRLGLQVARTLGKQIVRGLRRQGVAADIAEYVTVLERDGVLVIPNFLSNEQFCDVVGEFQEANRGVPLVPYKTVSNAKLYRTQLTVDDAPDKYPTIRKHFQENELLDRIAAAVLKRKITRRPDVLLDTYRSIDETCIDNDTENILHADLHTPTVKMFFYLNDVDEKNGAFVYAKGSHNLTIARLIHEYDLSVREAKLKKGVPIPDALLERRATQARNIIRPIHRKRMKVVETRFGVEPNTLVVANNMGFHRRGEFSASRPRMALLINYRKSERLFL
ncbi:MAG: phytanoyl-CoA dioxygenase family protein [Pyrinomonadaceae bacterium]